MPRGFLDDTEARRGELVEITAELRHETENAWLIFDGEREAWIPKSQAQHDGDVFTMPEWLAKRKELI